MSCERGRSARELREVALQKHRLNVALGSAGGATKPSRAEGRQVGGGERDGWGGMRTSRGFRKRMLLVEVCVCGLKLPLLSQGSPQRSPTWAGNSRFVVPTVDAVGFLGRRDREGSSTTLGGAGKLRSTGSWRCVRQCCRTLGLELRGSFDMTRFIRMCPCRSKDLCHYQWQSQ